MDVALNNLPRLICNKAVVLNLNSPCFVFTRPVLFSLPRRSAQLPCSPFTNLIRLRLGQSGLRDVTLATLLVHFTNAGILRQIIIFVTIPVFCFRSTSLTRLCALRMSR